MIANYHTHTYRCNHAVGTEADYVNAALAAGMKVLGFADHTPFPREGEYIFKYAKIRMQPGQLKEYVRNVLSLRAKYAGRLEIPLGVEIEYFPQFWKDQLSVLRDAGIEYLLLGQHWTCYEENGHYSGKPTDRENLLADYCRLLREGMHSGAITYVAHPDLFHYTGEQKTYERYMRALCRDAKSCGLPLEINLHGIDIQKHYPDLRFWELAAQEGCQVVLGIDSHAPESILDKQTEEKALAIARTCGLELLETVPLQRF